MFYTLAGAAKRTGLGEFTILRAIEEGRIAGMKDLFGDWQVHEFELRALTTVPDQNAGQKSVENKNTSVANNLGGETLDIFGPVVSDFNNEPAAHRSSELVPTAICVAAKKPWRLVHLADGRHKLPSKQAAKPHTNAHSASAWEDELWLNDEDKIAGGVPHSEICEFRKFPIRGILLVALGWAAGLSSYHLLLAGFTSSKQSIASEKQPPASNIGKPLRAETSSKAAGLPRSNAASHPTQRRMTSKPMLDQGRQTTGSIKQQDRVEQDRVVTPFPDTRPTTVSDWTLRSVTGGIAVLEGPYGTWKAARGDLVPGLGKVDSIVLWGNRWIVATTRGLVTTP